MAFTSSDLDGIRAAIASGVLEVRFADGRLMRYQTLDELLKAESRIIAALAAATPGGASRRIKTPGWRNGC